MVFGWVGLILGFSSLVFIHELGHFILAKWNGVRVHVFSIGMGPYLVSFTWRGTVYALSLIPLGGYVKLAGQDDMNPNLAPTKDPHDYRNKRPGQKAAILAAGATFNLLFTIAAFAFCYRAGVEVDPPRVGVVLPGTPLADAVLYQDGLPANLQAGDRINKVNGVNVKTMLEANLEVAGSRVGDDMILNVTRRELTPHIVDVTVHPKRDKAIGAPGLGLGAGNQYTETIALPLGFTTKDTVVVAVDPADAKKMPPPKDKDGKENLSPAARAGVFQEGDEIVSVAGHAITSREDMALAGPLSQGKPVEFVLLRDGKEIKATLAPEKDEEGVYKFGIMPGLKRQVVDVDPHSEAYEKGLREGNYINDFDVEKYKWEGANPGKQVWQKVAVYYSDKWNPKTLGETKQLTLDVPKTGTSRLIFTQKASVQEMYRCTTVGEALSVAWGDTLRFSRSVFTVIRGLLTRQVGGDAISGPIGIAGAMLKVASTQPWMKFLWFLGFISLNLGVLQFVPIPLLDGWHLLMVLVEKLKGSPVSLKVQEAFQYAGLFLIGALILLATYNDVVRLFH